MSNAFKTLPEFDSHGDTVWQAWQVTIPFSQMRKLRFCKFQAFVSVHTHRTGLNGDSNPAVHPFLSHEPKGNIAPCLFWFLLTFFFSKLLASSPYSIYLHASNYKLCFVLFPTSLLNTSCPCPFCLQHLSQPSDCSRSPFSAHMSPPLRSLLWSVPLSLLTPEQSTSLHFMDCCWVPPYPHVCIGPTVLWSFAQGSVCFSYWALCEMLWGKDNDTCLSSPVIPSESIW